MKSCATCINGDGEGTIRFCRVKGGAAFDVNTICDLWTEPEKETADADEILPFLPDE